MNREPISAKGGISRLQRSTATNLNPLISTPAIEKMVI